MLITKKSLMLSTALSLLAMSPCYAVDFDHLVNKLLGNTSASNTINIQQQAEVKAAIANRQAQIDQQIDAGARAGTLTAAEQTELRSGLNQVESIEGTFLADGQLTEPETRTLVDQLSRLDLKLHTYLTNSTTTGYASFGQDNGERWQHGHAYGHWTRRDRDNNPDDAASHAAQAMIDSKQAELDGEISRGVLNGTLSVHDSTALRTRLNQIAQAELNAQADGHITVREQDAIVADLNQVDASIKSHTRVGANGYRGYRGYTPATSTRSTATYRAYVHKKIADAVAAGQLNANQASVLYAQESDIAKREQRVGSGYTQQREILSALDTWSKRVDAELASFQSWSHR
jgi:hypothetical protein